MAVLQGKWLGHRGVALKGGFYVRTWRGKLVISAWPRSRKGTLSAASLQRMEDFKNAQLLSQYLIPQQQILAREVSEGTPLLPRDLLTAAMYGRLWAIVIKGGRTIYSKAAAHDVSENLELLPFARPIAAAPPPPPIVPTMEVEVSRLTKSGSDLKLSPLNGNVLSIDGTLETVPAAGVTLAPTGLTIDTDHFIYAFMSGATMTLEASTTGHATDATTGVEIKSGDSTRTLVGMARPITGPAWVDSDVQRFVVSWFNRRTITGRVQQNGVTSTSTTPAELSTALRIEFLTWPEDMPLIAVSGMVRNNGAGNWSGAAAALATTNLTPLNASTGSNANDLNAFGCVGSPASIAEGYHFSTVRCQVNAGTGTYWATNHTQIRG